ncbi:MAG: glycosyltransferase family 2 protein [Steroidobacteraceae bacterium]
METEPETSAATKPDVSIIVPFYNEEDNIQRVHQAIVSALEASGINFEMVFVDDGSKDTTFERACRLAETDVRVTLVKFRRNYGQTPAMAAGIQAAAGEVLVTMDGDMQNDPRDIPIFLAKIREGYDIVVGWRHDRKDKLVSRKIPSRIANWLIGKVTGVPIKDNGCSLKAYRAALIKAIPLYSEMHRFIPAMASIAGPSIAEVKVRHHAREYGQSKYGISRVYKVLLDLMVIKTITAFVSRPMVWFALIATPLFLIGCLTVGYAFFAWATGHNSLSLPIAGSGMILIASSFILGLSGIIGELIFKLGDLREHRLAALTWQTVHRNNL